MLRGDKFGEVGSRRLTCLTDGSTVEEEVLEKDRTTVAGAHWRRVEEGSAKQKPGSACGGPHRIIRRVDLRPIETIIFLASPGAGYITGQNIRIDGGLTRSF
jgi:NAD(P)-dependent dehydrogenase (short-subunit alcohol dehydrogenase family)